VGACCPWLAIWLNLSLVLALWASLVTITGPSPGLQVGILASPWTRFTAMSLSDALDSWLNMTAVFGSAHLTVSAAVPRLVSPQPCWLGYCWWLCVPWGATSPPGNLTGVWLPSSSVGTPHLV